MKKILHIPNYYPPHVGGIEDVCHQIVTGMKEYFIQKVICFNDKKMTEIDQYEGVDVVRVGVWKKFFSQSISFSYSRQLKKIIKEFDPDFIHLHLPNPFVTFLSLRLISKKTKIIIHWHSDIVDSKQQIIYLFYKYIEKKILEAAYKIIVTSPNYLEFSKPLRDFKEKVVVIQNTINTKKLLKQEGDDLEISKIKERYDKKIVFAFGRHVKYKGYEYLIDSVDFIASDCIILLAGKGKLTEKLKKQALNKNKKIFFLGRVNDEELRRYFFASDIFAFPSITKNEAFGLGLAEAGFCGLPSVTFTIKGSGVNWVCVDNDTGLEAENKNTKMYAKNIDNLLKNEVLRLKLGKDAEKRVKDMFVWDKISEKIFNLYR